jgi:hypothetical protein
MEREQQPDRVRGKFFNGIDSMLYRLCLDGWSNESSGSVEAPMGWFGRISISHAELPEVVAAFSEEFAGAGFTDTPALVGNFLVKESNLGLVDVDEYDTEAELIDAYGELEAQFVSWSREPES